MFEKNLTVAYLLDFYGDILSDRKRAVMDAYYNNDLSLSEIASVVGISRQGVRELIKKAEEELTFYEQKLHLAQRVTQVGEHAATLREMATRHRVPDEFLQEIQAIEDCIG